MRLEELDFELPQEAIAQAPTDPRDSCRLMRLTGTGERQHLRFSELDQVLSREDLLVFNDSKVLPARVQGRKSSGGAVELLFVRPLPCSEDGGGERWETLIRPSRRLRKGSEILIGGHKGVTVDESVGEGRWAVFATGGQSVRGLMERYGRLPVPPYIKEYPEESSVYQTVYAVNPGSAAAPTAGLHFTEALIERLEHRGVDMAWVTLHVGLDTFMPIREDVVEDHQIHTESYEVPSDTVSRLAATRAGGGRIIAVGTTVARVLETLGRDGHLNTMQKEADLAGATDIFITPGYEFEVVDALLTNFHLPRSSVLALTMAFAGMEEIREAYAEAIERGYRFFSFGDAMLVDGLTPQAGGGAG